MVYHGVLGLGSSMATRVQTIQTNILQYPIWVTLPELLLEFYRKDILQAIGNSMGSTIKIDGHTLEGDRR